MKVIIFVIAVISVVGVSAIAVPVEYKYIKPEQVPCSTPDSNNQALPNSAVLIQQESTGRVLNHNHNQEQGGLEAAASGISSNAQTASLAGRIVVGETGHSNLVNNEPNYSFALPLQQPPPSFTPNKVYTQNQYHYQPPIGRVPAIPAQLFGTNSFGYAGNRFEPSHPHMPIQSAFNVPIYHKTVKPLQHSQAPPVFSHSHFGPKGQASSINQQYVHSSFLNGFNSAATSSHVGGLNALNNQMNTIIRETFNKAPLDPTVEKHIYVHVPPEDLETHQRQESVQIPQIQPKKHYKIIFIKAPSQDTQLTQLAAAQNQYEEKTIVYVLVKKPEEPNFQDVQQIQQVIHKPSKPEVYFIKYKTRQEGEQASESLINSVSAQFGEQFSSGQQISNDNGYQYQPNFDNALNGYKANSGSDISAVNEGIDIRSSSSRSDKSFVKEITSSGSSASSNPVEEISSAASSSISSIDGPKHETYGVPLN